MKISEIPHCMEYEINEVNLREKAVDIEQMRKGIEFLLNKKENESNQIKKAIIGSLTAVYARLVGEYDTSIKLLNECIVVFTSNGNAARALASKVRLATTLLWNEKFASADKIYKECHLEIKQSAEPSLKSQEDSVLYYLGKCKFEQKQYGLAVDLLVKALELRIIKGDIELIQSTEKSINIARKKLESTKVSVE